MTKSNTKQQPRSQRLHYNHVPYSVLTLMHKKDIRTAKNWCHLRSRTAPKDNQGGTG